MNLPYGRLTALLALTLLLAPAATAHAAGKNKDLVQASLLADVAAIAPGSDFTIGVQLKLAPHWHTYWINPGENGQPTVIKLTGPKGLSFGQIRWPIPTRIEMDGAVTFGYEDQVLLMVPVTVAKDFAATGDVTIDADVEWLSCKETCVEGGAKLSLRLPVAAKATPANEALFDHWKKQTPRPLSDPAASAVVAAIEQPSADKGPASSLVVTWKKKPAKVQWFPAANNAVAVDDVKVKDDNGKTQITFLATVFQAAGVPDGIVDGVLVFENEAGERVGVQAPVKVALTK